MKIDSLKDNDYMKLNSEQAFALLIQGLENPGEIQYVLHSRNVGNLAGMIAKELGLDEEHAKVLGYLHDIGRKIYNANHMYEGYRYLKENGYEDVAYICLTHSFLNNDLECICASFLPPDSEGYDELKEFVESHKNTMYDKVIQTCDLLCLHSGGTTLEKRIEDIESRRGTHYKSKYHKDTAMHQKAEIEEMLGHSIYDFYKYL